MGSEVTKISSCGLELLCPSVRHQVFEKPSNNTLAEFWGVGKHRLQPPLNKTLSLCLISGQYRDVRATSLTLPNDRKAKSVKSTYNNWLSNAFFKTCFKL